MNGTRKSTTAHNVANDLPAKFLGKQTPPPQTTITIKTETGAEKVDNDRSSKEEDNQPTSSNNEQTPPPNKNENEDPEADAIRRRRLEHFLQNASNQ